jgi:D-sedoheptulose 7-phosphate isomerase
MNAHGVLKIAAESAALKQRFFAKNAGLLVEVGGRVAERLRAGGAVLVFGNGGSAADAQHFAGELVGCFLRDRAALPALALNADSAVLTAIGNDLGFESVFKRQIVEQAVAR